MTLDDAQEKGELRPVTSSPEQPPPARAPEPAKPSAAAAREARLAKALRDNLRRRKAAARAVPKDPAGAD